MEVSGGIGSSPEIYTHVNREKAAGQVIGFSGSVGEAQVNVTLNTENCLGVLDHAFSVNQGQIHLPFQFTRSDDTREAFILPNEGTGVGVESSTGWIDELKLDGKNQILTITPGNSGDFVIRIPAKYIHVSANGKTLTPEKEKVSDGFQFFRIQSSGNESLIVEWK